MPAGFLFDLDMTLVDSSGVAHLRDSKQWPQVMQKLAKVRGFAFDPPPHEVPAKLRALGHPVAVVTNSPRSYAEAVLRKFDVDYDVLVAYHDTTEHKPDPQPLELALEKLGLAPEDAYHLGDDRKDVEASYRAGVTSVHAGWSSCNVEEISAWAPDILLHEPSPLLVPGKLRRYGYAAERLLAGKGLQWHAGSAFPCEGEGRTSALGRYFVGSDKRHGKSPLTDALLLFKRDDKPAAKLAEALALFLENQDDDGPLLLVSVPPKPSQKRDRFAALFDELEPLLPSGVTIVRDALKCLSEIPDYKAMTRSARQAAVKGAYDTEFDWEGDNVLLVDDIHTTGSTVEACRSVLIEAGAANVDVFCFAKDQHSFDEPELCPACRTFRLKVTSRKDGGKFWGCSGFWKTGCKYTRDYP